MHIPAVRSKINYNDMFIVCGNDNIGFVTEIKVLGVIIDNKLKFSSHISSICKKVNAKTFCLSRTCTYSRRNSDLHYINFLSKLILITALHYISTLTT
jgi:hypothetical protein